MTEEQTWRADLKTLVDATQDRHLAARWNYYVGRHPKVYATPKLRQVFRTLADRFDENYCGLAINTRLSRLEVTGWEGPQADQAEEVWTRSRLHQRQGRLWRYALVHARAYLIADPDADGGPRLRINSATLVYGEPEDDDPDVMRWLGKVWADGPGWKATLWYPDGTFLLTSRKKNPRDLSGYVLDDEVPNATDGVVPGVELNPYDDGQPLIDAISGLQDRINKMASNKFVVAEFAAHDQRVFFTRQAVTPYDLQNAPDRAIVLDPGEAGAQASVTQLAGSDLAKIDSSKSEEVDSLFTIATLPRHLRVNPGSDPSGDAIKADEGPFVETIRDVQREMGAALQTAMGLLGIDAEPVWRDPTVHNDLTNAQVIQTLNDAGVPPKSTLSRYAGWTQDEVDEAMAAAAVQTGSGVGAALLSALNAPGVPTAG